MPSWLRAGASGWRLDVADELPDAFLDNLRAAAKRQDPQAIILGEVWEDASTKSAYGQRRRYLLGRQLDSVMNYPFREAILGYLTGGDPSAMMERILTIVENYPPQVLRLLMNHIGTHDTERALTVLGGEAHGQPRPRVAEHGPPFAGAAPGAVFCCCAWPPSCSSRCRACRASITATKPAWRATRTRSAAAATPWGSENRELVECYRRLGAMRARCDCLREGQLEPFSVTNRCSPTSDGRKGRDLLRREPQRPPQDDLSAARVA